MKRLLAMVLAVALGGCGTQAEMQAGRMKTAMAEEATARKPCVAAMVASDDGQALKAKFPVDGKPSMEMQTDETKPTEAEAKLLLAYHKRLSGCRKISLEGYAKVHPVYVSALTATYSEADGSFARLAMREITWGAYARDTVGRTERFQARMNLAREKIGAELDQSHAAEMREREQATRALGAWAAAQRATMPTTTNCVFIGAGMLSCNSY